MRQRSWVRWCVLLLCGLGSGCGLSGPAFGWGDDGHRIIALIAEPQLSPPVRARVRALLAADTTGLTDTTLAEQATWADKYRDSDRNTTRKRYEQTREWHYVNIPIAAAAADAEIVAACHGHPALPPGTAASAGPARACVIDKVEQFIAELHDPQTAPDERRLALQFLLHFIGDLHQPLHAADDRDRGGNDKPVLLPGFDPNNLHQFWDSTVVRRLGEQPARVARGLARGIGPLQRRAWSRGSPAGWARESFEVARTRAYAQLPAAAADGRRALTPAYVADATQAAKLQLRKAGVRLAWVLNRALGP